jgi:2-iminoacetate synthase ThiH
MTRDELIDLLETPDPLVAARLAGVAPGGVVTYSRAESPEAWLRDVDAEQPVEAHRDAHRRGTPSEAIVRYGAGVSAAHSVDRLIALAEVAGQTGLLRAVRPVPADGDDRRPGSWGVEDLVVIGIARYLMPSDVQVRPDWVHLGAAASQIAIAFGATDIQLPEGDETTDIEWLAGAVGYQAVAR